MLKYVSRILTTISPAQRLIALSILVLAIVIMYTGPTIVDGFTKDNEELKGKISLQKEEIHDLTSRVRELGKQVIDNERECINNILEKEKSLLQKEKEILSVIVEIERLAMVSTAAPVPQLSRTESVRAAPVLLDSAGVDSDSAVVELKPVPVYTPAQPSNTTQQAVIHKVRHLKNKLQKDLTK